MAYSVNSRIREIIADERAKEILDKHIPGASTHPQLPMAMGMTLKEISWYPETGLTPEKLQALVKDLEALG
jgi:hypothetical protein